MTIYNDTITIFNILDGADSDSGKKELFKTVITDCGWYSESMSSISGSTVSTGQKVKVLIPFDKGYSPYSEWKTEQTGFTARPSDYVFKGESSEVVTISTISKIANDNKPYAVKIDFVEVLEERTGVPVKIEVRIEG